MRLFTASVLIAASFFAAACSSSQKDDRHAAATSPPLEQHTHYHVLVSPDGTVSQAGPSANMVQTALQPIDPSTPVPDGYYRSGDQIVPDSYHPAHMHWTPYGWVPDGYQTAWQSQQNDPNSDGAPPPPYYYPYPYPAYGPYYHRHRPYTPYPVAAHWPYVVNHVHYHYHHLVPTPPGMLGRGEGGEERSAMRERGEH